MIMIYAGTIILNLLAASVDERFHSVKYQTQGNSTLSGMMEGDENDSTVRSVTHHFFFYFWISLKCVNLSFLG